MSISRFRLSACLILLLIFLFPPAGLVAEDEASGVTLGFSAVLPVGTVTTAIVPEGEAIGGGDPYDFSYGVGVYIEYTLTPALRIVLDGNHYSYKKLVAEGGDYGTSFWVFEQTGYTSNLVGTFSEDAYFYMDATGFRLSAKLSLPTKKIRPWIGAGLGYYYWTASYQTEDRSGTWGSDDGYAWGASYQCGLDFQFFFSPDDFIWLSAFGDFASPVAYPTIYDLFNDGWTWENAGGNHIMGPYRAGFSIAFPI